MAANLTPATTLWWSPLIMTGVYLLVRGAQLVRLELDRRELERRLQRARSISERLEREAYQMRWGKS